MLGTRACPLRTDLSQRPVAGPGLGAAVCHCADEIRTVPGEEAPARAES
jgi:hypothetical protein